MNTTQPNLIDDVETFLAETGMGASYFGKRATGNSELVARLRSGRRCWPETAARVREFIASERLRRTDPVHGAAA